MFAQIAISNIGQRSRPTLAQRSRQIRAEFGVKAAVLELLAYLLARRREKIPGAKCVGPSQVRMAAIIGVHVSTIGHAIKALCECGRIERIVRWARDGTYLTNLYRIVEDRADAMRARLVNLFQWKLQHRKKIVKPGALVSVAVHLAKMQDKLKATAFNNPPALQSSGATSAPTAETPTIAAAEAAAGRQGIKAWLTARRKR